jgi:hypothetical protein
VSLVNKNLLGLLAKLSWVMRDMLLVVCLDPETDGEPEPVKHKAKHQPVVIDDTLDEDLVSDGQQSLLSSFSSSPRLNHRAIGRNNRTVIRSRQA